MGFINIMKSQENPDGIEGHIERERFQDWSKQFPEKRRFTGRGVRQPTVPFVSPSAQRILDNEYMQKNCVYWTRGCKITNCAPDCHRVIAIKKKEKLREKELGITLVRAKRKEDRDRDLKRRDYWQSDIAFECPISGVQHMVMDCLNSCDKWGRRFQAAANDGGTEMVLHCCADTEGERELRTGVPTKMRVTAEDPVADNQPVSVVP